MAGGLRQRNLSATDLLWWQDSDASRISSLNQPLQVACATALWRSWALLDAQLAQQSGLSPFCSKHSVVAGRATAIAADSRSYAIQGLINKSGRSEIKILNQ